MDFVIIPLIKVDLKSMNNYFWWVRFRFIWAQRFQNLGHVLVECAPPIALFLTICSSMYELLIISFALLNELNWVHHLNPNALFIIKAEFPFLIGLNALSLVIVLIQRRYLWIDLSGRGLFLPKAFKKKFKVNQIYNSQDYYYGRGSRVHTLMMFGLVFCAPIGVIIPYIVYVFFQIGLLIFWVLYQGILKLIQGVKIINKDMTQVDSKKWIFPIGLFYGFYKKWWIKQDLKKQLFIQEHPEILAQFEAKRLKKLKNNSVKKLKKYL